MEVNLREFIREYKKTMDQECQVTRHGEIIGLWIPYNKLKEYEAGAQD